ncbi:MAG: hypothetical protein GY772_32600, partial [bacterium]|nr:hypothetical protein [bacterium]
MTGLSPERFTGPAIFAGGSTPGQSFECTELTAQEAFEVGGTPRELVKVGEVPPHKTLTRMGRDEADIVRMGCDVGDFRFPVLRQDPAWVRPEAYAQSPPHQVVIQTEVARNLYISSMSNIEELSTSAEVDLNNPEVIASSRKATALLRHNALFQRLLMDDGGWVPIGALARRVRRTVGAMIVIAAADQKGRFQLAHHRVAGEPRSALLIRAPKGHSISSLLDARRFVSPPYDDVRRWPYLVHATHYECVLDILRLGLLPGGARWCAEESRNHVHFVPFGPEDYRVVSGSRRSAKAFLFFNKWAVFAHSDLWLTPSMAILTRDGVPWSDLEIIVLYTGSNSDRRTCLRRTVYDAALAAFAVEEPSDFARQIFKRSHPEARGAVGSAGGKGHRGAASSGAVGVAAGSSSGAVGVAAGSTMDDDPMSSGAVGVAGPSSSGPVGSAASAEDPVSPREGAPRSATPSGSVGDADDVESVGTRFDRGYAYPVLQKGGTSSGKRQRTHGVFGKGEPKGKGGGKKGKGDPLSPADRSRTPKGGRADSGTV